MHIAILPLLLLAQAEPVTTAAPGVWLREGDLKAYGHCNNVVIEMKDFLIVVDSNFPSGAKSLQAKIPELSNKPVRYVILTHHHGDHAYGNALWTRAGATTIAHKDMVEEMKRYEPKRWQEEIHKREDVKAVNSPTLEPPKETFDKSPRVFDDGTRRVEVWHFGWGHTKGDAYIWLPKERILIPGDAIVNGAYNYTGDSHLANWIQILTRIEKQLKPAMILPGHGKAGGPEILRGQIEFFEAMQKTVATQVKAKVAANQLKPPPPSKWTGDSIQKQLTDFHIEATTGKPAGATIR
jgi:cyclase